MEVLYKVSKGWRLTNAQPILFYSRNYRDAFKIPSQLLRGKTFSVLLIEVTQFSAQFWKHYIYSVLLIEVTQFLVQFWKHHIYSVLFFRSDSVFSSVLTTSNLLSFINRNINDSVFSSVLKTSKLLSFQHQKMLVFKSKSISWQNKYKVEKSRWYSRWNICGGLRNAISIGMNNWLQGVVLRVALRSVTK